MSRLLTFIDDDTKALFLAVIITLLIDALIVGGIVGLILLVK